MTGQLNLTATTTPRTYVTLLHLLPRVIISRQGEISGQRLTLVHTGVNDLMRPVIVIYELKTAGRCLIHHLCSPTLSKLLRNPIRKHAHSYHCYPASISGKVHSHSADLGPRAQLQRREHRNLHSGVVLTGKGKILSCDHQSMTDCLLDGSLSWIPPFPSTI